MPQEAISRGEMYPEEKDIETELNSLENADHSAQPQRPKINLMPALSNTVRTYGGTEILEKGFVAKAIRNKQINSRSQLDAIKDGLDMQCEEEIEALEGTSFTVENDPVISIIDSELADIESLFSIGNAVNERVAGEIDTLKEELARMVAKDPELAKQSEENLEKMIIAKAKGLRFFQLSPDEEWALNLVDDRKNSGQKQEEYVTSEVRILAKEIKQ
ncbi:MAG: hypothetical protein V4509_05330 [Patescibacteria group bacterium]